MVCSFEWCVLELSSRVDTCTRDLQVISVIEISLRVVLTIDFHDC